MQAAAEPAKMGSEMGLEIYVTAAAKPTYKAESMSRPEVPQ